MHCDTSSGKANQMKIGSLCEELKRKTCGKCAAWQTLCVWEIQSSRTVKLKIYLGGKNKLTNWVRNTEWYTRYGQDMNEPERDINKTLKIQLVRKIGPFPHTPPHTFVKNKANPSFCASFWTNFIFMQARIFSLFFSLSLSLCLHADSSH